MALRVLIGSLAFLIATTPSTAHDRWQKPDALEAAFAHESYAPESNALLRVWTEARVTIQIFRSGTETEVTHHDDVMLGTPVTPKRTLGDLGEDRSLAVRIGRWPSG